MTQAVSPERDTGQVFQDFLVQHCQFRGLRLKTVEGYTWAVEKLISVCPVMPATVAHIETLHGQEAGLSPVSLRDLDRAVRIFLKWAEHYYGYPNPLRDVPVMTKAKVLPRVLNDAEIWQLWGACRGRRDMAMIGLLLDTGIRLAELSGLRWSAIGDDEITVDGKRGPRIVPVSRIVRELLDGLGDGDYLWVAQDGERRRDHPGPMSRHAVQAAVNRVFDRSGLPGRKLGPRTLRHTFAVHYINGGGNLGHLQKILGHASINITEMYLNFALGMIKDAHNKHSPAVRWIAMSRASAQRDAGQG